MIESTVLCRILEETKLWLSALKTSLFWWIFYISILKGHQLSSAVPRVIVSELNHGGLGDQKWGKMCRQELWSSLSLFQLIVFLSVHIVVSEKEDASYAVCHSFLSVIFFSCSLRAFHCIEMYTPAATFPQSNPFPSLSCRHFLTTRPTVTHFNKNGD